MNTEFIVKLLINRGWLNVHDRLPIYLPIHQRTIGNIFSDGDKMVSSVIFACDCDFFHLLCIPKAVILVALPGVQRSAEDGFSSVRTFFFA
jgi:hypothetical protein